MLEPLCVRELRVDGAGPTEKVRVTIGKPEMSGDSEYVCPFQVFGLQSTDLQYAHGVDCLQALLLAVEGVRARLEGSGKSLTWVGGQPGDHGFPRLVPAFYGLDFSNRINRLIDKEIESFSDKARRLPGKA